jgi:predicted ABC-type transport system involved in lysophospholipase L1 biosynthesis ATPase subunit
MSHRSHPLRTHHPHRPASRAALCAQQVLRGASFQVRRGEAVGIIGGSGTGKSTALRIAAGLLAPDHGEVLIKGVPRRGLLSDDDTSAKLKVCVCWAWIRGRGGGGHELVQSRLLSRSEVS